MADQEEFDRITGGRYDPATILKAKLATILVTDTSENRQSFRDCAELIVAAMDNDRDVDMAAVVLFDIATEAASPVGRVAAMAWALAQRAAVMIEAHSGNDPDEARRHVASWLARMT